MTIILICVQLPEPGPPLEKMRTSQVSIVQNGENRQRKNWCLQNQVHLARFKGQVYTFHNNVFLLVLFDVFVHTSLAQICQLFERTFRSFGFDF